MENVVRSLWRGGAGLGTLAVAAATLGAQQDSVGALPVQGATLESRTVIEVDSLDRAAFANVAELLQARVPGLHISRTGDGGMRWYMRGPASVSESIPMVLIDGVRLNMAGSSMPEFGTRLPLLEEIDLEDVERVEVWSGPATAASYGTGAGNGVIRIVTFAPRAQETTLRIATAAGIASENVTYPANFTRPGVDTAGAFVRWCTLSVQARGGCTPTGPPTSLNVLESDSPFETALSARVAAALASGSERLAWRGGATFDRQGSTTGALASQRFHLRGAGAIRTMQHLDATVRAHWTRGDADLPSLNELSLLRQGLLARADTAWPGFVEPHSSQYGAMRYGATAIAAWRPREWFDARLTSGLERMLDEDDLEFTLPGGFGFEPVDVDTRGERRRRDLTVRLDAEARYGAGAIRHATALTVERAVSKQEEEFSGVLRRDGRPVAGRAFGINLRTGILGVGLTQRVDAGRAALVGGLRLDEVALNGVEWDVPLFPHLSLSWDARRFAPAALGGVRFRAALGDVANVPQTMRFFFLISPSQPERPRAEVTRERELGLDVMAAQDRIGLSFTWYTKRTSNISDVVDAPFAGFGRMEVLNRGTETSLRARVLQRGRLSWDVRAWYAHNHNEVTRSELGGHPLSVGQPGVFTRQSVWIGQPLGAHRAFDITSIRDLDGDGLVDNACFEGSTCEVTLALRPRFRAAFPPSSAGLETSLRIGGVTLSALLDHRSGHATQNATLEQRCFLQCQGLFDPATSFRDQAEALVAPEGAIEDAGYTKLREISLRFGTPAQWARALGASRLDITVAGRNVATWTDYTGLDPEATSLTWVPLAQVDNVATPLPRRFLVRVDLYGR